MTGISLSSVNNITINQSSHKINQPNGAEVLTLYLEINFLLLACLWLINLMTLIVDVFNLVRRSLLLKKALDEILYSIPDCIFTGKYT